MTEGVTSSAHATATHQALLLRQPSSRATATHATAAARAVPHGPPEAAVTLHAPRFRAQHGRSHGVEDAARQARSGGWARAPHDQAAGSVGATISVGATSSVGAIGFVGAIAGVSNAAGAIGVVGAAGGTVGHH